MGMGYNGGMRRSTGKEKAGSTSRSCGVPRKREEGWEEGYLQIVFYRAEDEMLSLFLQVGKVR